MNIAIVLSGGIGSRLGAMIPKQYIEVNGKPIIAYTIETLQNHADIDYIQIVCNREWHEEIKKWTGDKFHGFSEPGENRQLSILNALRDILEFADKSDYILIQDAVRPLTSEKIIHNCMKNLEKCDGVMPALPMKDTVYLASDGQINSLLDRNKVIAGQAPEAFRLGEYYRATVDLLPEKILSINGSAEPAILAGMSVSYIPGDENNFKITTKADLRRFQQMMEQE